MDGFFEPGLFVFRFDSLESRKGTAPDTDTWGHTSPTESYKKRASVNLHSCLLTVGPARSSDTSSPCEVLLIRARVGAPQSFANNKHPRRRRESFSLAFSVFSKSPQSHVVAQLVGNVLECSSTEIGWIVLMSPKFYKGSVGSVSASWTL